MIREEPLDQLPLDQLPHAPFQPAAGTDRKSVV